MASNKNLALKWAGIEVLPLEYYQGDAQATRQALEMAEAGATIGPEHLPLPTLPIRQIFADDQGDHYLVLPTLDESPLALPYITGSDLDINNGNFNQGGFVPLAHLPEFQLPPPLLNPVQPDSKDAAHVANGFNDQTPISKSPAPTQSLGERRLSRMKAQLKSKALLSPAEGIVPFSPTPATDQLLIVPEQEQGLKPAPSGSSNGVIDPALLGQMAQAAANSVQCGDAATGAMLGLVRGQLEGLLQSQLPQELSGVARMGFDYLMNQAQQQLTGLISGGSGVNGLVGNPSNSPSTPQNAEGGLLGNWAQSAGTMAVDKLVGMGFDALTENWTVDDESSTLEHVAHKYGKQALAMIQDFIKEQLKKALGLDSAKNKPGDADSNLLKKIDEFFNGVKATPAAVATATLSAAHITSKDDKVDVVANGQDAVLVEGKSVARITDVLMPSGKIILEGSATVLAGGLSVSRVTAKTAVPSVILTGAPSVLIGGPAVSVSAPVVPKPKPAIPKSSNGSSDSSCGGKGKNSGDNSDSGQDRGNGNKANKEDTSEQNGGQQLKTESSKDQNSHQDYASAKKRKEEIRAQLINNDDLTEDQRQSLIDEHNEIEKAFPECDWDDEKIQCDNDGKMPVKPEENLNPEIKYKLPDDIVKKLEEFGNDRKKKIEFLNDMAARIGGGVDFASLTGGIGKTAANQASLLALDLQLAAASLEEDPEIALRKTQAILAGQVTEVFLEKAMESTAGFMPKPVAGAIYAAAKPVSKGAGQLMSLYTEGGVEKIGDDIAEDFGKVYESSKAVFNMYYNILSYKFFGENNNKN